MLDELEKQIDISNQTLKASEAAWRQARALVSQARAAYLPTRRACTPMPRARADRASSSGTGGSVAAARASRQPVRGRRRPPPGTSTSGARSAAPSRATWPTRRRARRIWPRRGCPPRRRSRPTTSSCASPMSSKQLLDETVAAYQRSLQITAEPVQGRGRRQGRRHHRRRPSWTGPQSQQIAIGVTRATLEHAIAVLVGKAPADFSLAAGHARRERAGGRRPGYPRRCWSADPTSPPPSASMAAANAQIGVAIAAYFPDLTLSGSYGFASNVVSGLVQGAEQGVVLRRQRHRDAVRLRSALGAGATRRAPPTTSTVANYRQAVLTALPAGRGRARDAAHPRGSRIAVQEQTVQSAN